MSLVVLAGPAGVGKGSIVRWILENQPGFTLSVSATTRDPRPGEVDGVHYHFVTVDKFQELIDKNQMLEWAQVHGKHFYGTPLSELARAEAEGKHLLLEIDLQGARQVKSAMPEARLIFIAPPSWDELVRRLTSRGTESPAEQERRLETAKIELAAQSEFDHVVVNDEVARCAAEVVNLMQS